MSQARTNSLLTPRTQPRILARLTTGALVRRTNVSIKMGKPVGPIALMTFPILARQIEVRQVEVHKGALENNHTQTFSSLHPDKKVLKGLEDIEVDDIEGRIVEYGSPVPRRFLDHPHGCRIRFGHDSSSFKVQASGTGL